MKKALMLLPLVLLFFPQTSAAQFIPYQYPWKTYFNPTTNRVFITGNTANNELFAIQYTNGQQDWYQEYPNSSSTIDDRGLDIIGMDGGDVYVTGYTTNSFGDKDIVLLKYSATGTLMETEIIDRAGEEDAGVSLAIDEENNVYVAGYITSSFNNTDIYVMKYDQYLEPVWNTFVEYDDETYGDNDIGLKILVDGNHVYISGYSYRGETYLEDVVRLIYDRETGDKSPDYAEIYPVAESNERPINYIITEDRSSEVPIRKSVTTGICQQDNIGSLYTNDFDYLIIRYDYNDQQGIEWVQTRDNGLNKADIPTDIVADSLRNIYVTGYTLSTTNEGYNFLTVKYDEDGNEIWASSTDLAGDEQATSIVLDGSNVKVTGYCASAQNQYLQESYSRIFGDYNSAPVSAYYKPGYLQQNTGLKGAAFSNTDKSGDISTVYMGWNETEQFYALRKVSKEGKIIYSVEKSIFADNVSSIYSYKLEQNYPNPFNPVTSIKYSIPQDGFTTLSVYDISGKEIAKLVHETKQAGDYTVSFNAAGKPSGVYFYKLQVNGFIQTNKMILIK